jgi:hypothetical protein
MRTFKNLGAAECVFVERHPVYYGICRARGFHGNLDDFIRNPYVPLADLIYLRGSITQGNFKPGAFLHWLEAINKAAPKALICPWSPRPVLGWFAGAFVEAGYQELPWVMGYNEAIYPTVWRRG